MSIKYSPVVFAVEDEYQICIIPNKETIIWIEIAGKCYREETSGILHSETKVRRISVPRDVLDLAQEYTVCETEIILRRDYFSKLEPVIRYTYKFRPVNSHAPRAYHIADAHGMVDAPVKAARHFEASVGKMDFLILNGDVIDSSARVENFETVYKICDELTSGEIPVVFARGNHDTRGVCAEQFENYVPTVRGRSFFTFRLGSIFGFVVDCGEDKNDSSIEYGGTVAFHEYRLAETDYIMNKLSSRKPEYTSCDVKFRLIISHAPFTLKNSPPFNIEEDIYSSWALAFKEEFSPRLMISGHTHSFETHMPGDDSDVFGHPCPIIVASEPKFQKGVGFLGYRGVGFVFSEDGIKTVTTDENGVLSEWEI